MKMKQIRLAGKLQTIAAFTFGAALGSIGALLYAPASGQVTRKRLTSKIRTFQRTAARRLGQTQRALVDRAEQVREAASGWIAEHVPHNGNGRVYSRRPRHAHVN